jgi:WD40 repeat protein
LKTIVSNNVTSLSVLLAKNLLASGHENGNITIWNIRNGLIERNLSGHISRVQCLRILTNNRLASGSYDRTIKIWNSQSGQLVRTIGPQSYAVMTMEVLSGELLASASFLNLQIWNISNGDLLRSIDMKSMHLVRSLATLLLNEEAYLASSFFYSSNVSIVSTTSGDLVRTISTRSNLFVNQVATLSDGNLAVEESSGEIGIYDANNGQLLRSLVVVDVGRRVDWFVNTLVALSDCRLISVVDDEGVIRIWNVQSGQIEREFKAHEDSILALDVLSDGHLVTASLGHIKIWS